MDLNNIREYLDDFDKSICTLLLHRMSLIPLVAETKLKNNSDIFQEDREKYMFSKIKDFCDSSKFNTKMIEDIYRRIIDEAYVIEKEIIKNNETNNIDCNRETSEKVQDYIKRIGLLNKDSDGFISEELTKCYKKMLSK